MAEYISKQRAKDLMGCCLASVKAEYKAAKDEFTKARFGDYISSIQSMIDVIGKVEAADVQPVKRGEWDFRGYQLFKCTSCKEIFTQNQLEAMVNHTDDEFVFPNFCPKCGARMDGEHE